jgi:hypothetical protein
MIVPLLALALTLTPASGFRHSSGLDVVLVQQDDLPLVVLGLVVRDDPRQLPDLQVEVTDQLLRARVGDEEGETADRLRLLGGDATAIEGPDGALWTFGVHPEDLSEALDRMAELLSRPQPVKDRSGQAWGTMPPSVASGLHQLARARALGHEVRPTAPTSAWPKPFVDHTNAWVVPGNARLLVAGDVDEVELRKHLDHALASWPKTTPDRLPKSADRNADSEPVAQIVGLRGAERPGYAAAFRLPPAGLRSIALWLLATEGVGARGWQLAADPDNGLYSAAARSDVSAEDLQGDLIGGLEAIADGLPDGLHARRIRIVRNRILAGFDGRAGAVRTWAQLRALGVGPSELPTLMAALEETRAADLQAFAKALLTGSRRIEVLETRR